MAVRGRVRGAFVGLTTVDLVQRVVRLPGPDEKVTALRADLAAGGPAAVAAVTFAALGGVATLVTAVGAGPLAEVVGRDLASYDVQVVDCSPDGDGPAVSSAVVEDGTGRRSVVSRNAADRDVAPSAELDRVVAAADVVLVDGHHPRLALAAARAARTAEVPVVLDAGSWKPVLDELLPLVDVAVCSADLVLPESVDPLVGLPARGVRSVAVSDGARPVRWHEGERWGAVEVPAVRAVDTVGAGDVLHGAFAHAWAAGERDLEAALGRAVAVASVRVQHAGPRGWLAALPGRPSRAAAEGPPVSRA